MSSRTRLEQYISASDIDILNNSIDIPLIDTPNIKHIETEEDWIRKGIEIEVQLKGQRLYHNLKLKDLEEQLPGPRIAFTADYGPEDNNTQKRILITDRKVINSKRAKHNQTKGCDTRNDFKILAQLGPDAYKHHVSPVVDIFKVIGDDGNEHVTTVAKDFEGYRNLNALLPELKTNPLTQKEFSILTSDVLDGLGYLDGHKYPIYHRDLSLRNIITNIRPKKEYYEHNEGAFAKQDTYANAIKGMIQDAQSLAKKIFAKKKHEGEKLEAIIVDLANACNKDHTKLTPQPTLGAQQITDPLMLSQFGSKIYGDSQECYATALNFLELLHGEQFTKIDLLDGIAQVIDNKFTKGFNLLDENGRFKNDNYNKLISTAISNLPRHAKKYAPVFRRALSLDEKERYSSTKEFIKDWNKQSKKDFSHRIKYAALGLAGAVMIASAGYTIDSIFNKQTPMDVYRVHSEWNIDTKEVDNNLFDVKMMVSSKHSATKIDPQYIFAKKGEELYAYISMFYRALDKKYEPGTIYFRGRAYVEGLGTDTASNTNIERFFINPVPPGSWSDMGDLGNTKYIFDNLKIPKDALPGSVYNMVVELYAMDDTAKVRGWNSEKQDYEEENTAIIFDNADKAIYTKRIPILVPNDFEVIFGSRKEMAGALMCNGLDQIGYYNPTISFNAVSETDNYACADKDVKVLARIPEIGYLKKFSSEDGAGSSNSRHYRLDLPSGDSLKSLTLQVVSYKNGKILNQSFFPVERVNTKERIVFHDYVECLPDTSYSNKVVKYSQEAERLIK